MNTQHGRTQEIRVLSKKRFNLIYHGELATRRSFQHSSERMKEIEFT